MIDQRRTEDSREAYAHGGLEVSTHFLREQVKLVLDESLDLVLPRHRISSFCIPILRDPVSPIEVVTQILTGIDTRLDQLGFLFVQAPDLSEERPTGRASVQIANH